MKSSSVFVSRSSPMWMRHGTQYEENNYVTSKSKSVSNIHLRHDSKNVSRMSIHENTLSPDFLVILGSASACQRVQNGND